ncbi:MAG: phosphatidylglycerophosphatase A [Gammaproteobacteria bacterium]|nr:phosphatidylglycerophosphatase A [Gammaproteobacteria bacterium]
MKLLFNPLHFISFLGGVGFSPIVPGTLATVVAWISYSAFLAQLPALTLYLFLGIGFFIGCLAAHCSAKALKHPDPSAIVIDEVIAFWFLLSLPSYGEVPIPQWLLFGLFRFFDISKPFFIKRVDHYFKQPGKENWVGLGIMLDDLVATACAYLVALVILESVSLSYL